MGYRIARLAALLACLAINVSASVYELVENGAYEQPLSVGWEENIVGSSMYIQRLTTLDLDPDFEVRAYTNNGSGSASLSQKLCLPSLDTVFSANLRSSATDGNGAWCAAGMMISYLDAFSAPLGRTFLGARGAACPWENDDTFHIIRVGGTWETLNFVIVDELVDLPGVDPSQVAQLEVSLLVTASNC